MFIASCPCILDMERLTYVCATCEEHFTRRYSTTRHNHTIQNGRGEFVGLIEYLVGRSSGRYRASHPFWRNKVQSDRFGSATVADYVGDTFGTTATGIMKLMLLQIPKEKRMTERLCKGRCSLIRLP